MRVDSDFLQVGDQRQSQLTTNAGTTGVDPLGICMRRTVTNNVSQDKSVPTVVNAV
jgi:hypothetical protein